jgi:hypothetical protein
VALIISGKVLDFHLRPVALGPSHDPVIMRGIEATERIDLTLH